MSKIKSFFNKPAMTFNKILLLGMCAVFLMAVNDIFGRFYGITHDIWLALFVAVTLALGLQLIRIRNEIRNE